MSRPRNYWHTAPEYERNRKQVALTIPDETRSRLDELSEQTGMSRSAVVERLIHAARTFVLYDGEEPQGVFLSREDAILYASEHGITGYQVRPV